MKIWTAHTRAGTAPELVREGFSIGALLFGPLWLLAHRAWIPGVLALCAGVAACLAPIPDRWVLLVALAWLQGLLGRDLLRWSLSRRGFRLAHVLAASNEDMALTRLLDRAPEQISEVLR